MQTSVSTTPRKPNPSEPEVIKTDKKRIACDGDDGALGHPRVFLTMEKDGVIECPYCDRRYILAGGPADNGL